MSNTDPAVSATTRRADLDWVRVGAFGLLILYHVGMAFVTWSWHVKTAHPADTIEPAMMLLSPWRLALLFLVSGCATRFMSGRIAPGALAWRRLGRLGIPLLFGMLVIVPPQSWVQVREHHFVIGYWAFYAKYLSFYEGYCDAQGCLILPTWNHLWFVAYLLAYTLVLALCLSLLPNPRPNRPAPAAAPGFALSACLVVGPVIWLTVIRQTMAHSFPLNQTFVQDWYAHAIYAPMFLFGFAVARWTPFWTLALKLRGLALCLALSAYAGMMWIDLVAYPGDAVPPDRIILLYRCFYGLDQWMWIMAVLGFAHRHLRHGSRILTYLTQGVFPFYILHQTIIVLTEFWLKRLGLPQPAEAALLVAATILGCWGGYELIRRVAVLRPLFGLRRATTSVPRDGTPEAGLPQPLGVAH